MLPLHLDEKNPKNDKGTVKNTSKTQKKKS
jgi:hypothetical protein